MKFDMDFIAHNNNLSLMNPYYKLIIAILIMLFSLIVNNLIIDIIVFILMGILITLVAKISFKSYLKFITIPFIFSAITCLYLIFFTGTGEIIFNTHFFGIVVTDKSLNLGINTFCRVFACFSCLGFLALTTPIAEILHCLRSCKVPKIFIEISLLMYNTIFIFLDQLDRMRNAQETRLGYFGTKSAYHSLASLFTNLFVKSLDKSEKLQCALDSRCYDGEIPIYKPSKVKKDA